jgi:bifunctional non-homologous end joining protein LigD
MKKDATQTSAGKSVPKRAAKKEAAPGSAAGLVDEQLSRYREMRDFETTAEPSGTGKKATRAAAGRTSPASVKASGGLPFVIQKHAASHLHYDFRLGWAGVLKSWAVAKGPSFHPKDRRLAVQVEDHPMEYGGFEGIIPKGQYGGGTVMVWDQGTWWPQPGHENVDAGLREGSLKFEMHGTKMKVKWTLVRMNTKPGDKGGRWGSSSKPNWLLIKEHDDFERGPDEPAITDEAPDSAVTGRTMEQIATQEDHVWNSKETAGPGQAWYRQEAKDEEPPPKAKPGKRKETGPARGARRSFGAETAKLPRETQPEFVAPQLAMEATAPPDTPGWLYELKLDGYRIQARKAGTKVRLLTRKGLDWTHRMEPVAEAVAKLEPDRVTLDGEVVVLAENGTTSFADLQAWFQNGDPAALSYFAFDLLHLEGHNTRGLGLRKRKALLADVLDGHTTEALQFSEHLEEGGPEMFHKACELHAEGIVSKLADAPYAGKRSAAWLKSKCLREQEFVIAGFTDSTEGPGRIGSLLLGVYDDAGTLVYSGRTGTGFTQKMKRDLYAQLHTVTTSTMPFASKPSDARRDVHWVKPSFVAQVRFATWTAENLVRQAAFLGLREDKPALEVRREEAAVSPRPKAGKAAGATFAVAPRPRASAMVSAAPAAKAAKVLPPQKAVSKTTAKTTAKNGVLSVRLTHPDKILDPESGLTKRELAEYYWAVAERMLPHIADRPLSLVRCPEGAGKPCFYQKHVNHMLPPGIESVMVTDKKSGKPEPYITLSTVEALAGLAQMGVLEVHPWGAKNDNLEHPDRLILDLDPDESLAWPVVTSAAAEVRARLKKLGLVSFLKTTGGKGLHVVAPIQPTLTFAELKDAAHRIALSMERAQPTLYLTKMTKAARTGKIYLDYLRNERGATAVAPYSPRARYGAHVSLPLPWSALALSERPVFPVREFASWSSQLRTDPWKAMLTTTQTLDPALLARP